jgi:hypothetical protein
VFLLNDHNAMSAGKPQICSVFALGAGVTGTPTARGGSRALAGGAGSDAGATNRVVVAGMAMPCCQEQIAGWYAPSPRQIGAVMNRRSSIPLLQAARMRRCSIKLRVPPGGLGMGLSDLMAFLRARLGEIGFDIVPAVWDWEGDAVAIVFDDATAAAEIAEWVDRRWPPAPG